MNNVRRFRDIAANVGATVTTIRVLCSAETAAERVRLRLANGEQGPTENAIRQIDAELSGATDIDFTVSNESSFDDFYRRIDTVMQHYALGSLASVDGETSGLSLVARDFGERSNEMAWIRLGHRLWNPDTRPPRQTRKSHPFPSSDF